MKKITLFLFGLLASMQVIRAQAPVPTSFDFENFVAIPSGWTITDISTAGGLTYTAANSCGSTALRLDADDEALTIHVGQQPGPVTFSIRATGPWGNGIFRIQESVDGVAYSNMLTFNNSNVMPNSSCTTLTVTPANTLSRYIRFFYEDKISGANTAIDDVTIAAPLLTAATLSAETGGDIVFNNTFAPPVSGPVSTNTQLNFDLKNIGTVDSLLIDTIYLSGPDAADFSINNPVAFPDTILPSGNLAMTINFNPSTAGTKLATIHIESNDSLTPVYLIQLYAGAGGLATEPTSQATNLTFPVNKTYRVIGNFSTANPAPDVLGGYLILRHDGTAGTDLPVDGTTYERGQNIGSSKVVYSGPISGNNFSFRPTWIHAASTYHFSVFTYNGNGSVINYNTNSPLTGSVTTPNSMVASGEYNGINTSSANFIADLTALINPHDDQFYSTYAPTMIYLFQTRDTFAVVGANTFRRVITCAYSREEKLYNEPFDWTGTGYSREHSYAHTWMPSYPADNPEKPEYNDQHNLYPTRQTNVNALRCNYPFGEVVTPQTTFLEGVLGLDANGKKVYEPSDKQKGKTARALMYMATCYNGISGNNWAFTDSIGNCSGIPINYGQDQNILKKWHYDFPPDNFDMARNDFLDSLQENRNPFVDHPEYACFIDFSNMSKIANPVIPCNTIGINEADPNFSNFLMLPNPASESITITTAALENNTVTMTITDITGKVVMNKELKVLSGDNQWNIDISQMNTGVYFVLVNNGTTLMKQKLIKK